MGTIDDLLIGIDKLGGSYVKESNANLTIRDKVHRGSPQGDILYPLLTITTINSHLSTLSEEGVDLVCYEYVKLLRAENSKHLCKMAEEAV